MRSHLANLLLFGLLLLPACVWYVTPPGTRFASTPPGARVLVDGRDTGFLTPCLIALDEDRDHRVEIALDGFEPARLRLLEGGTRYILYLTAGVAYPAASFSFPLLLPTTDLVLPVRLDDRLGPSRIYVELKPLSAAGAPGASGEQ
jgi:hypothetical protein